MICLDSDCIIDFLNGRKEAVRVVEKYKEEIVTTEINAFEVFFGIYNKINLNKSEENSASLFFNTIKILPMEIGLGKKTVKLLADLIKRGKVIEQNDCLIASIMLKNGCGSIITNNIKPFSVIPEINVVSY